MQTFLSEYSFPASAQALDNKRLNKQLLEGRQILDALINHKGWVHHPATRMWAGYELALYEYLWAVREELRGRGIKWQTNWSAIETLVYPLDPTYTQLPDWWTGPERVNIVTTHRGRLYEKDPNSYPDYYLEYTTYRDYTCCKRCNYYWPTHLEG